MPDFPSIITGTITSTSRSVGGITIQLKNLSTNENLTTTTETNGGYVFDAANFASGYTLGDTVELSNGDNQPTHDDNINIDNAKIELI